MNDEKNCQSSLCSEKKCQETQSINKQPVKTSVDMQLPKPAVPYKYTRLCSDKNCQSTRCYKIKSPKRPMCGDDKNCQSTQCMQLLKPEMKKSSVMLLPNPAMEQSTYKFNQDNKNYQSNRCFKEKCPMKPVARTINLLILCEIWIWRKPIFFMQSV